MSYSFLSANMDNIESSTDKYYTLPIIMNQIDNETETNIFSELKNKIL